MTTKALFGFLILFIFSYSEKSTAQDIHFSEFNMFPVYLNPAMAGNFDGDYRFNAIYRSQWKAVSRPYSTVGISADSKNVGVKNLGLGVHFFHDVTADGNFRTVDFMVSGSYELNINNLIDKSKTERIGHIVTPGIQFGLNHRQIDLSKLSFDSQYNGWYYDPGAATGENFTTYKKSNFNLNIGLTYHWIKNKRMRVLAGYASANITRPNQTFFGNEEIRRDIRHTIHLEGQFKLAKEWDLIPRVFMNFQGVYSELIFGAEAKYILKDERGSYMAGYLGAYLRNKDAVYLTLTFDYNNWKAGFSYDMNFSKLSPASNVRGGFEISLQYILKTFKPKKVQHRVCPDYI